MSAPPASIALTQLFYSGGLYGKDGGQPGSLTDQEHITLTLSRLGLMSLMRRHRHCADHTAWSRTLCCA